MTLDERLIQIRPGKRQLEHQKLEFYAFVHFTVNTFTDKEWGDGTENPEIFNPVKMDARQWCKAIKAAGMKGLILTCKHHDGFCLWPSKYTKHTVAASPYKNGKGDIVREVSEACREFGLKFGVYLSPWDRNNKLYGQGKLYDDFFVNQLTELLTNYGEVFSVWFDGACGEGPNGKKQIYDFERYYSVIRKLQPEACISVCGPDLRWCGNEAGHCRKSEWSVVPARTKDTEIIKEQSQHEDSAEFRQRKISASDQDLGSRSILQNENDLIWYPAEVNTSIRPGWFYHEYEDNKVKSLEELTDIYFNSVGGNATFLLNIPPAPDGLFHKNDVQRLQELGNFLKKEFANPKIELNQDEIQHLLQWDGKNYSLEIDLLNAKSKSTAFENNTTTPSSQNDFSSQKLKYIVIQEDIKQSQRVENFEISGRNNKMLYLGTTIGYKKIIRLNETTGSSGFITIKITDCRCEPKLMSIKIY